MKFSGLILGLLMLMVCWQPLDAQVVRTVGPSGADYTTLRAAFAAVNSGALTGSITFQVTGNLIENNSAVLNASGTGSPASNYSSIIVYPVAVGVTISGDLNAPLIDFNGAANVTIDGRVNATGAVRSMTIINLKASTNAGISTFRFINGANNNTIRYCHIKGSGANAATGTILFSTSSSQSGNHHNTLDHNALTGNNENRPVNVVYSLGSTGSGLDNSYNVLINNMFSDFLHYSRRSQAVYLGTGNSYWTISGNSFFETTGFSPSGGDVSYYIIYIESPSGTSFNVNGNFIGGQAAQCGGSAWSKSNAKNNLFCAIYLNAATGAASSIQGNTIRNFQWANSRAAFWTAIQISGGDADIGTTTGNIIGDTTGTGSITVTAGDSPPSLYGINILTTGAVNCSNNLIGSITAAHSNSQRGHHLYAISKGAVSGSTTISNNFIGSKSTPGSVRSSSPSTTNNQNLYGINSAGTGFNTISGNTISGLLNGQTTFTGTTQTVGIQTTAGSNAIENNVVANIATSTALYGLFPANVSAAGITQKCSTAGTLQVIRGNTVYGISSSTPTQRVRIAAITWLGPASGNHEISANFIYGLTLSTSDVSSFIDGILLEGGSVLCANNIVNLGDNLIKGYTISGIYDNSGSGNLSRIYFNTLYIGGTVTQGVTSGTAALRNTSNACPRDYRNNILFNQRSGGNTGKHYAVYLAGTTTLTIDYNDYFINGSGGVLAYLTNDKVTLAALQAATGQDLHSLNMDPLLGSPGSNQPSGYYPLAQLTGVAGTGITVDFAGMTRSIPPLMGALELRDFIWKGSVNTDFGTAANWLSNMVPPSGNDLIFDPAPVNHCILDQQRTVGNIFISQSNKILMVNGKTLIIEGELELTGGAQIDATASQSTVVFAGELQQTIDSASFYNDSVANLIVDNAAGLRIGSDLIVFHDLNINTGKKITVDPKRCLTVSGVLDNQAGSDAFILESDATGTARLNHTTSNVPATVQRYINGASEDWHFLSAPVADQQIGENEGAADSWLPSGTYGNGTGYDLYVWNEPTHCWIYKLNTTAPVNWNTVHPGSVFSPGRGYLYSLQALHPVKTFRGLLNSGTVTVNLTAQSPHPDLSGFNLVGNPYPSAIDWSALQGWERDDLTVSGGGHDVWIWNPAANNYGVYNSTDGDGIGTNAASRYIAPAQGFFVRAISDGTLGMDNRIRVSSDVPWFKSTKEQKSRINLVAVSDAGRGFDEVRINFGFPDSSGGAAKLFSEVASAPGLYLSHSSGYLSVLYSSVPESCPAVPVMFNPGGDGGFTFTADFDPADFNIVMLEDRFRHYIHDLKAKKSYHFEASSTDDRYRFILRLAPESSPATDELPVRVFSRYGRLVIDLSLIGKTTEVLASDMQGRIVLKQSLAGSQLHTLEMPARDQLLIFRFQNPDGQAIRKFSGF